MGDGVGGAAMRGKAVPASYPTEPQLGVARGLVEDKPWKMACMRRRGRNSRTRVLLRYRYNVHITRRWKGDVVVSLSLENRCGSKTCFAQKWLVSRAELIVLRRVERRRRGFHMGIVSAALALTAVATTATVPPNPIHDAAKYTTFVGNHSHGLHFRVTAPDALPFSVVHTYGTASQRGQAHGYLLSAQVIHMIEHQMQAFYEQYVRDINLGGLPDWLKKAIEKLLLQPLSKAAPAVFDLALTFVAAEQKKYNTASAAAVYDEMAGIAQGACLAAEEAGLKCDTTKLHRALVHVNMLPDLIRMQCSMLGAAASATADGHLVQLRTLDFGAGPFANNSVLLVHHPASPSVPPSAPAAPVHQPFAALSFPGFVGVVTGVTPHLSISEKVNDIHGGGSPKGSYAGQSTSFVIRDMLELAASGQEAVALAQAATRTWGIWLGVGDGATNEFVALEYMRASAIAYNASTLPALTGQTPFEDVAFIDKHPQPSTDTAMRRAVAPMLPGKVTAETIAQNVPRYTQSGDVHIAVYDWDRTDPTLLVALGSTSANGTYVGTGGRSAWAAPFVRFPMKALWAQVPAPPKK